MEPKQKAPRSAAYPAIGLEDAFNRLLKVPDRIGVNGPFNRETVATGIGYTSLNGASARAVAALVHYGLLRREKDYYYVSDLGKNWLLPTDEHIRPKLIKEAAITPKLFANLYSEYSGQALPRLLNNRLVAQYGIQPKVADEVVTLFREALSYAGLLSENDMVLHDTPDSATIQNVANSEPAPIRSGDDTGIGTEEPMAPKRASDADTLATNQGVAYTGDGWSLNVSLKSTYPLDQQSRLKLRALMAAADDLTDALEAIER